MATSVAAIGNVGTPRRRAIECRLCKDCWRKAVTATARVALGADIGGARMILPLQRSWSKGHRRRDVALPRTTIRTAS